MHNYDLIADWYPTERGPTIGVVEALAVAESLRASSRILDLGCGNGVPITKALVHAGHRVVGLDSSAGMLAHFRVNLPATPIVRADVRDCPFATGSFDAAISWGMLFHLTPGDQDLALANVSRLLKPGAPFLFTATEIEGADEAGITGTMQGVSFHYYAVDSYRRLLDAHGMMLVNVHDDPGVSTYYISRKRSLPHGGLSVDIGCGGISLHTHMGYVTQ
jgi:SAM-dependent methyltransferase